MKHSSPIRKGSALDFLGGYSGCSDDIQESRGADEQGKRGEGQQRDIVHIKDDHLLEVRKLAAYDVPLYSRMTDKREEMARCRRSSIPELQNDSIISAMAQRSPSGQYWSCGFTRGDFVQAVSNCSHVCVTRLGGGVVYRLAPAVMHQVPSNLKPSDIRICT